MKALRKKNLNHPKGMTIIEILVAVALIGLIMALGAALLIPGDETRLRNQAGALAGTIKFVYNEAAITNKFFRIHFDLDENYYVVESSTEPFYVRMETEENDLNRDNEKPKETELGSDGEELQPPPAFIGEEGLLFKKIQLPKGVKIKNIMVLHGQAPQDIGKVYAYFLPNGWAEPMVVNLSDEEEESFYSLEVNPLTGKTKIRGEYWEVDQEALKAGKEGSK